MSAAEGQRRILVRDEHHKHQIGIKEIFFSYLGRRMLLEGIDQATCEVQRTVRHSTLTAVFHWFAILVCKPVRQRVGKVKCFPDRTEYRFV